MEKGTRVNLMGVHSSVRVPCVDEVEQMRDEHGELVFDVQPVEGDGDTAASGEARVPVMYAPNPCPREHFYAAGIGRFHYEDAERSGLPGTVIGTEKQGGRVIYGEPVQVEGDPVEGDDGEMVPTFTTETPVELEIPPSGADRIVVLLDNGSEVTADAEDVVPV